MTYISSALVSVSGGVLSLNALTSSNQTFATGTTGSTFNIVSSGGTHTFHIPDASATARGFVSTTTQTFAGDKTFSGIVAFSSTVTGLTKTTVGLGNVDNTSDATKNVLSATQLTTAITINGVSFNGTANITVADSTKEPIITAGTTAQYWRGDKSWQTLNATAVGLGNVDNTSDANKPISTATQTALDLKANYIRRVNSQTSTATLTPVYGTIDDYIITAQAVALTIASPTGTANNGEQFIIRIKDNGTARAITWNAIYRGIGVTLPTTTTANKTMYLGCKFNSTDTKIDVIAFSQEA